ncbi:caspase family protein [Flavitalea sp.]|nr:caspase family protein [Flavitalea sp.]
MLVGINNYPVKPLGGCINDVNAVEEYLQKMYGTNKNITLKIKRITDEDSINPTRENIIAGFEHFNNAAENDTCFFYYSGHGSWSPAPKEFWSEVDMRSESFVCIDSRVPGGKDLMDKEMGYLIWKTMAGKKQTRFIVITDCCHCGTITRDLEDSGITERMMPYASEAVSFKEYLGYESRVNGIKYYNPEKDTVTGEIKATFRQGNHIHLAASRENQTAKELNIDGVKRGAFTYSLLKTLHSINGNISYQDLIKKTLLVLENLVYDQQPTLNLYENEKTDYTNDFFLTRASYEREILENNWTELPELTQLPASKRPYELGLYRNNIAGYYKESNFEKLDLNDVINDFRYLEDEGGELHQPAFRLFIKNTSQEPLWVSNAYLGFDNKISTDFFEIIERLAPGNKAWLTFVNEESQEATVLLNIDEKYAELGYNEITEYLKLFISTQPIDPDKVKQDGLDIPVMKTRSGDYHSPSSIAAKIPVGAFNWYTETIGFRIIHPSRKNRH